MYSLPSYERMSHGGWDLPICEREKCTIEVPNNNPKEYRRHAYFDAIRKGKSKLRFDQKALKKKKQKKKKPNTTFFQK